MTALQALADQPRWVAWRNESRGDRLAKVPFAPGGGRARANDPATWGTRADAEAMATTIINGHGGGIGIQLGDLGGDTYLAGIDLDHCLHEDGTIAAWAKPILDSVESYAEKSPSGSGIKLFFYAASEDVRAFLDHIGAPPQQWGVRRDVPGEDARNHGPAIEVYFSHRYFAVTERRWATAPDKLATLDHETLERLVPLIPPTRASQSGGRYTGRPRAAGGDNSRSAIAFRKGIQFCRQHADCTYEDMAAALRADPATGAWCREKGNVYGGRELRRVWQRASANREKSVIDPAAPLDTARLFLAQENSTLRYHRDTFYEWSGSCYPELAESELRARLYAFLEKCSNANGKGIPQPFKPTMVRVANVVDALRAAAHLPAAIEPPAWLDQTSGLAPENLIACRNGILHPPALTLFPQSPAFFTRNALDFDFDPQPPPPLNWLRFLDDLWANDPASIETLQEIFGYCLTPDTRQQKMFLIVGPKRSGKGTIARVLTRLVGIDNTIAPTLAALGLNFGLAPLIDKRVAVISDARLGGRADQHAITERLLSITGEDAITIDRKYREPWTGRLQTRFLILSNELPTLADVSGALANRFIVLVLISSFYGREDLGLIDRLLVELPGILNWSIEGRGRLNARGYFTQPKSALSALQQFEDLGSPIGAYIREECQVGPNYSVETNRLFQDWQAWCDRHGRKHPGSAQTFGRDLHAAVPGLTVRQPRDGAARSRFYQGIGLR
jgi:putative DNA primase/helicase